MRKLTFISLILVVSAMLVLPSFSVIADDDEGVPWFGLLPYMLTGGPPNGEPKAVFSADPTSGQVPLVVDFDASSSADPDGSIESYEWDFDDGNSDTGEQVSHTYNSAGNYTPELTVTDDDGKTDSYSDLTISVTSTNESPNASFTASSTSGTAPLDVTFDASDSSDPDGSIDSYSWDFGDGSTGSGETITHTYSNSGSYTAQLTVEDDDGATDSTTMDISVTSSSNEPPTASFTASTKSGEAPLDVNFDASDSNDPDGNIVSYDWGFGDGSTGSGETTSHTFDTAGDYTVELTVTDNDGASDSSTKQIEVTSAGKPDTTITSGPSGTIDYRDVTFEWTGSDDKTATSDLTYSYMLKGVDNSWSNWTYDTSKSYSDLSYGEHTFKVKAKDSDGNTDPTPATRSFTVKVLEPGITKWTKDIAVLWSSPAIASSGTIYVGENDSSLYAVNPDGTLKWTVSGADGSPTIGPEGTIYVNGRWDGKLYAIAPNGTIKWTFSTGNKMFSSPAISSDGTIYVGNSGNKLYAVNPDGSKKWVFDTGDVIHSSPAIAPDGTIYVASWDGNLYAINPNGTKKWSLEIGSTYSSPIIGKDGTVYIDGNAITPNGDLKWSIVAGGNKNQMSIGSDGKIYMPNHDPSGDNLIAVDSEGNKVWSFAVEGEITGTPVIGKNKVVYFGTQEGKFYALKPDGTKKWSIDIGEIYASPVIGSDGTLFVGGISREVSFYSEGKLYAIYTDSGDSANTPWPMFQHDKRHTGRAE